MKPICPGGPKPHLSASQIEKFLKCMRSWAYQYVRGLRSKDSGATVQGSAWHKAIEYGYRQVIAGEALPSPETLCEVFCAEFEQKLQEAEDMDNLELRDGEEEGELLAEGIRLTRAHATEIAPRVQPAEVERKITVSLGEGFPFDLVGYIDVITVDGWIRDNKARSVKRGIPKQSDLDSDIQLGIYALLYRAEFQKIESGLALDICVKSNPVQAKTCMTQRTTGRVKWTLGLIEHMARALVAEAYPPCAPQSGQAQWWCSPKWCDHWQKCQVDGDWEMGRKI